MSGVAEDIKGTKCFVFEVTGESSMGQRDIVKGTATGKSHNRICHGCAPAESNNAALFLTRR